MQKVIRATERAKTQARRKNVMRQARTDSERRSSLRTQQNRKAKDHHSLIQAARIARREDWLLGPLAPRRDLGSSKNTYGAIHPRVVQDIKKHENIRDYCIAKGDRVVMVGEFQEKGLIGIVKSVTERAETCTVGGFNMVCSHDTKHIVIFQSDRAWSTTRKSHIDDLNTDHTSRSMSHPLSSCSRKTRTKIQSKLRKPRFPYQPSVSFTLYAIARLVL